MIFTVIRKYGAVFHGRTQVAEVKSFSFDALFAATDGRHTRITTVPLCVICLAGTATQDPS